MADGGCDGLRGDDEADEEESTPEIVLIAAEASLGTVEDFDIDDDDQFALEVERDLRPIGDRDAAAAAADGPPSSIRAAAASGTVELMFDQCSSDDEDEDEDDKGGDHNISTVKEARLNSTTADDFDAADAFTDSDAKDLLQTPLQTLKDPSLSAADKQRALSQALIRAASNGDIGRVQELLGMLAQHQRQFSLGGGDQLIDIDARDQDGSESSALCYAACWGHAEVVRMLVDTGCDLEIKDKHGWTPLMWACTNGHVEVAKILLEAGASIDAKSNRGRSLKDIVRGDSTGRIRVLLGEENFVGDASPVEPLTPSSRDDDISPMAATPTNPSRLSVEDDDDDSEKNVAEATPFDWEKCSFDQMIVFDEAKLNSIIRVVVNSLRHKQTSGTSQKPKPLAANVIFLCARYAHYWGGAEDMLDDLFLKFLAAVNTDVHRNADDAHVIAHWIANTTQLLYYLKRDKGLLLSTIEHQAALSELIHEISLAYVKNIERQVSQILDVAMIDYDAEGGGRKIRFENPIAAFGRRLTQLRGQQRVLASGGDLSPTSTSSSSSSSSSPTNSPLLKPTSPALYPRITPPKRSRQRPQNAYELSPRSLTALLNSSLTTLTSARCHPQLTSQIMTQACHFLTSELFNRYLTHKDLHSRSAAIRLRLNLMHLEDHFRELATEVATSTLGRRLTASLRPCIQALTFLSVVSSLRDLGEMIETLASLDALTIPQAGRLMESYRYELGEPSFPDELHAYVLKVCDDIRRAVVLERGTGRWDDILDPCDGLADPHLALPFMVPCFGEGEGVGWGWAGCRPGLSDEIMRLLDS